MTRLQLRTLVWDYVDDPSGGYFTAPVVNMRLNLAQRELQKRMLKANRQYCTRVVATPLVAGQANYALPSDFIQEVRLEYVTQGSGDTASTHPILPATPNQREIVFQTSGNPLFYTFDKNNIVLQPVPTSTQSLRLTYSYLVADMTADSDVPDLPEQYQEYISVICARDCLLKDGRSIASLEVKLKEYTETMDSIAQQRNIDKPRMVVQTDGYGY